MTAPQSTRERVEPQITPTSLRDIALFGALSDDVLDHLSHALKTVRFAPGDTVFREGDPAKELFVVLDGEFEVFKKSRRGRDMRVAILGPNDCFGEMSLIDMQNRSATVRAVAPGRALRMSTEDMDRLYRLDLKAYTLIVLNIARDLSRRLRVTDSILADFTASVLDEYMVQRK